MTYSTGNIVLASDFNGFASTNAGANLNDFWGTGSGDLGWGQTAVGTVSTGGSVSATNWASLINNLASSGSQTNTTLTSRTAPTAGNLINILSNVSTDLGSLTTNRGNAASIVNTYRALGEPVPAGLFGSG